MDFIFIIGPSGVGKTTLAKELYKYFNSVYFEQNMIPEFGIPENVDQGKYEEQILRECSLQILMHFHYIGEKYNCFRF